MRPLYGIVSAHKLPEMRLSANDRLVLELFGELNETRIAQRYVGAAADLARRGFLTNNGNRWFSKTQFDLLSEEPQHIWLPNSVVDGAAEETPPLALLRQMQDVRCMRLFLALYDGTDLPNEGGVARRFLFDGHTLTKISERGACTIWRFPEAGKRFSVPNSPLHEPFLTGKCGKDGRDTGSPDFWATLAKLEACGLLTFIPHVFESEQPEGEILHAYPLGETGEVWERGVAEAADTAARSLLDLEQKKWAAENKQHFLPVPSHIGPAVIGIARLRYRPQTRKTAAWLAQSKERSDAWRRQYETISQSENPRQSSVLSSKSR